MRLSLKRCHHLNACLFLLHQQVLMNLVCSSLKYTHSGAIKISAVSTETGVHVVVADTGAGIPALQLQQALDPFELVRPWCVTHSMAHGLHGCWRRGCDATGLITLL
jgi:K+-sensing histidine kinase KdpD